MKLKHLAITQNLW